MVCAAPRRPAGQLMVDLDLEWNDLMEISDLVENKKLMERPHGNKRLCGNNKRPRGIKERRHRINLKSN